jgi:hypothetical protein
MSCFFVRGLSRSGGTLMATIMDAHPDVAMSYETYEHLLVPDKSTGYQLEDILEKISTDLLSSLKNILFSKNSKTDSNFKKFVGRAERAGINQQTLAKLFKEHFEAGFSLDTFKERMLFVERLTREKMQRDHKQYWGAKIVSIYDQLDELYPDAHYMFMLRDGRDIAASRKKVGDFNQTIEHIADGWCQQIKKFEKFANKTNDRAFFVHYENLAHDPENELKALMDKLGLPWSDRLLNYHDLNLSIHRHPTGHLSGKQVKSPINTSSIGRWKKDLTKEETERFEAQAGNMLEKLGYIS